MTSLFSTNKWNSNSFVGWQEGGVYLVLKMLLKGCGIKHPLTNQAQYYISSQTKTRNDLVIHAKINLHIKFTF